MRTTIELPGELFRRIKARAALQGATLKQYVTDALRDSLYRHDPASVIGEPATAYGEDTLVLREDCVLPLVVGEAGEEMSSLSEERIAEIFEEEEIERALPPP